MRWVLPWPLCALGARVGSEECWWWLRALGPLAMTRSISATLLNLCQISVCSSSGPIGDLLARQPGSAPCILGVRGDSP